MRICIIYNEEEYRKKGFSLFARLLQGLQIFSAKIDGIHLCKMENCASQKIEIYQTNENCLRPKETHWQKSEHLDGIKGEDFYSKNRLQMKSITMVFGIGFNAQIENANEINF